MTKLDLHIPLNSPTGNLVVKCVLNKKEYSSDYLRDFTKDVFSDQIANLCAKVTNHQSAIVLPMLDGSRCIGAILFSKNYIDSFEKEYSVLRAFTDHVAVAIINAQKFQKLQQEINTLKNER